MNQAMKTKGVQLRLVILIFGGLILSLQGYAARPTIKLLSDTAFLEPFESLVPPALAQNDVGDSLHIRRLGTLDSAHLGTYKIKLYATDTLKRSSDTLLLIVVVRDNIPPSITLKKPLSLTLKQGDTFKEKGYIVIDNFDSNCYVSMGGSFKNTNTAGIYVLTYQAIDFSGNKSPVAVRNITVVDTTTGIEEAFTMPLMVKTWPNPASDVAYMEAGSAQVEQMEIHLYDMLGRKKATIASGKFPKTTFPINTSALPDGTYFILGTIGESRITAKVLVAH